MLACSMLPKLTGVASESLITLPPVNENIAVKPCVIRFSTLTIRRCELKLPSRGFRTLILP